MDRPKFEVAVKDRASQREYTLSVGGPNINSQEEAELHVATSPRSMGGGHPGHDVTPKDAEKFKKLAADRKVVIEEPQ